MFQNRLRTAALAGAIAVATGISGLAVPAFAVETTQNDGFNTADSSAAAAVAAKNVTEAQLRDKTDATTDYLSPLQNGDLEAVLNDYLAVTDSADGFDPSEEAAKAAFEAAQAEAGAQLATNSQVIQDARASVKHANDADDAATAAWDALVVALQDSADDINSLIRANNEANTHQGTFQLHDELATPVTRWNAIDAYESLLALQLDVDAQWKEAGIWNIDETDGEYVNRTHIATLEALKNKIDAEVAVATPKFDDALDKNREAQKSDVIVRQLFLERATAQRDVLRTVEATFSVAARYVELTQDDVLYNDGALSTEYRNVLDNLLTGLRANLDSLDEADKATEESFLIWESDLPNNDDGNENYHLKLEFASQTYANIRTTGTVWQEELNRVTLIDSGIIAESEALAAEQERLEEERAAAKEAAAEQAENARKAAAAQEELNRLLAEIAAQKNETPAPAPIEKADGSSEHAGLFGVIAAIGGIAALIAAAFPFISNFMR